MITPSHNHWKIMKETEPKNYSRKYKVSKTNCKACGKEFLPRNGGKHCSLECKLQTQKSHLRVRNSFYELSTGSVGALAELMVCCDLLTKGYEVFRAISPSCSCDLIALKNNVSLRIEVRTGMYQKSGKVCFPGKIRADIVAAVTHIDKKIHYIPEL